MNWKNIIINESQIEATTERSYLIKVPGGDGWKFWHPAKCVHERGDQYSLGYTDDFVFRLFRNGQGHYNFKEKIAEKEVGADEIEQLFAGNRAAYDRQRQIDRPFTEVIEPEYVAPTKNRVADDLRV